MATSEEGHSDGSSRNSAIKTTISHMQPKRGKAATGLPPRRGNVKAAIFDDFLEAFLRMMSPVGASSHFSRGRSDGSRRNSAIKTTPKKGKAATWLLPRGGEVQSIILHNLLEGFPSMRRPVDAPSHSGEGDAVSTRDLSQVDESLDFTSSSDAGATSNEDLQSPTTHLMQIMKCSRYLFLFLPDYEFDKDSMIQLWVAAGIFEPEIGERMEILGGDIFDSMVEREVILPSRFDNDCSCSLLKYRLTKEAASCLESFKAPIEMWAPNDNLIVEEAQLGTTSKLTKHLSLVCESFDSCTIKILRDLRDLCTLILFCKNDASINHVPHDLFLYLKKLRTLNLSGSGISELPDSIGHLESLRYLDVSRTPIECFPESIDSLYLLQTIKLVGCLEFHELPKNTKHLICLRHLDLDIIGQLKYMPKGMGNLRSLQTLRAFLIGKEDGCQVGELKNMVNLTGSFCISRLENISTSAEARGAELNNKTYLNKLELRWGGCHIDGTEVEEEILECLQPHFGIKELDILFFNGARLPTWMSDPSFTDIVSITFFQCKNCSLLPSLGRLPSLKFLEIYKMNGIRVIDHIFCRNDWSLEHRAFPKLEKLTLDVMLNLEEWTGVEKGDFASLLEFKIRNCPKLFSLPLLSHLSSLTCLEIIECMELQSFPDDGLPASLEVMIVKDCPKIKERLTDLNGQDWSKIAHVPSAFLDHEQILPKKGEL